METTEQQIYLNLKTVDFFTITRYASEAVKRFSCSDESSAHLKTILGGEWTSRSASRIRKAFAGFMMEHEEVIFNFDFRTGMNHIEFRGGNPIEIDVDYDVTEN